MALVIAPDIALDSNGTVKEGTPPVISPKSVNNNISITEVPSLETARVVPLRHKVTLSRSSWN